MSRPFSRIGRLRTARGLALLAVLALPTAAVPAAVYHAASARAYATAPAARPNVGLDTAFTLTVLRKPGGRRITIKGHVHLNSGITPALLSVLEGCPLPSSPSAATTGGAAAGASMGLAQVSATPALSVSLLQRLQQWGTAYSVMLSLDQARVSGVTADQGRRAAPQETALWAALRHALGPGYAVQSLSEQRVRTIGGLAGAHCTATPPGRVLGAMRAARTRARGVLRHWLDATWSTTMPCLGTYDALTADVAAIVRGQTDPSTLNGALVKEERACAHIAVPPVPHALAHNRTALAAVAALKRAVMAGQLAAGTLPFIATGDANACSVQHVLDELGNGTAEATTYVRLVDRLKRAYALAVPRVHGHSTARVTLPHLPSSCPGNSR